MSDSILRVKQEVLLRFFEHISLNKQLIKIPDLDNLENIIVTNKEFKELETEIIDLLNDLTYYAMTKLDIKLNGVDETMINKIALQKAKNASVEKKRDSMKYNTYTKLYKQNVNMEKIKLQEIKKSNRNILRNNKSIIFEITKDIYLNYFCDNMKDIIIVEKLLLIFEPFIASQKILMNKKQESKNNKAQVNSESYKKSQEQQSRGRRATKDIKHTEIDLTTGKNSSDMKNENERYQSKSKEKSGKKRDLSVSNVSDKKKIKKKKKALINTSLSKSHSQDVERESKEAIKSNDFSVSKINETNLNSKKKRRKTKKKNKAELKQNTPDQNRNLSEDKSFISDDNVEKNKLNFFQALKNVTTNMLLESKIKGENVECIIEPEVIPDLDKILAEPSSKTQRNTNDLGKQLNKNLNLSNDDYDYNNITDRSNILSNHQRNKILLSKRSNNQGENTQITQNNYKSNGEDKFKINKDAINKSILINVSMDDENEKKEIRDVKSNNNNIPPLDRSGIYRVENSNHDLSKENRLELVSTNDKNEYKNKQKEKAEKSDFIRETNTNSEIKSHRDKIDKSKAKKDTNGGNNEIRNEDIILNEKINEIDRIKTKNTEEINSLGKTPNKIVDKGAKRIEDDNNLTKKRKNSEGCKCACSIF